MTSNGDQIDIITGGCNPCEFTAKPTTGSLTNGMLSLSIIDGDPLTFECNVASSANKPLWQLNGFTGSLDNPGTAAHFLGAHSLITSQKKVSGSWTATSSAADAAPLRLVIDLAAGDNGGRLKCVNSLNSDPVTVRVVTSPDFAITAGNTGTNFAINAVTGELTTAKGNLDEDEYTLTIEYYADTSMPKESVTKTIKVTP